MVGEKEEPGLVEVQPLKLLAKVVDADADACADVGDDVILALDTEMEQLQRERVALGLLAEPTVDFRC